METANTNKEPIYRSISLTVREEVKEEYEKHAKEMGETVSAFLRRAAKEQMLRDSIYLRD